MDKDAGPREIVPQQFIVGEVSKNWENGYPVSNGLLLCELFERVIQVNLERGYRLHSFALHQILTGPGSMTETIVAVFERIQAQ